MVAQKPGVAVVAQLEGGQMGQTYLVQCLGKAVIPRPPLAHHHAATVGPEDRRRIAASSDSVAARPPLRPANDGA